MCGHRITMWWRDRWASSELHHLMFEGSDRDIFKLLDRYEVEAYPLVTIEVDQPNPSALEYDLWGARLCVEAERSVIITNSGVLYVGVVLGSEDRRGEVDFTNPRGFVTKVSADIVIGRELGFQAMRAWLHGCESAVVGLEWDLYRNRARH